MNLKEEQLLNLYEYAVQTNVIAENWHNQLYKIFRLIDDNANINRIREEIKVLITIYEKIENNPGLNGFFKHYAMNLTTLIEAYEESDTEGTLSDLRSEDLIYISSKIDALIKSDSKQKNLE